jgi:hypothetical protein
MSAASISSTGENGVECRRGVKSVEENINRGRNGETRNGINGGVAAASAAINGALYQQRAYLFMAAKRHNL